MRGITRLVVAAAAVALVGLQQRAEAGLIGSPLALRGVVRHIRVAAPTLPPMAFTMFCLKYVNECKPHRIAFRGGPVRLTTERLAELKTVNHDVNAAIVPERNTEGLAGEKWLINPASG